jgi:hypothetical protein
LNKGIHHLVNLSLTGLRDQLCDLLHNGNGVFGVYGKSITDLLVVFSVDGVSCGTSNDLGGCVCS